jgi:hypothetical protein
MLEFIWDIIVDLIDLPIGRRLFGPGYRRAGDKTPAHQLIVSGLVALVAAGAVLGGVIWGVVLSARR